MIGAMILSLLWILVTRLALPIRLEPPVPGQRVLWPRMCIYMRRPSTWEPDGNE